MVEIALNTLRGWEYSLIAGLAVVAQNTISWKTSTADGFGVLFSALFSNVPQAWRLALLGPRHARNFSIDAHQYWQTIIALIAWSPHTLRACNQITRPSLRRVRYKATYPSMLSQSHPPVFGTGRKATMKPRSSRDQSLSICFYDYWEAERQAQ